MIIPAGLYGCEVGHCPKAELQNLESAIAQTLGPRSARRSLALTMEMVSTGGEVDPRAHMLTRKISLLVRILAKYPACKTKAQALLCAYQTQHMQGTSTWDPTTTQQTYHQHHGPISQILADLHSMHAHITTDFTIQQHNEAPFPILQTPWQNIKPLTTAIAQRARYNQHHTQRNHTQHTPQLDHQALHRALRKQTVDDRAIIRYIGTGAAWTQGHLQTANPQDNGHLCRLCGMAEMSIEHGLWHCCVVQQTARLIRQKQHIAATEQMAADKAQEQEQWVHNMFNKHVAGNHTTMQGQVGAPAAGTSGVGSAGSLNQTKKHGTDTPTTSSHQTNPIDHQQGGRPHSPGDLRNTMQGQAGAPAAGASGVGSAASLGQITKHDIDIPNSSHRTTTTNQKQGEAPHTPATGTLSRVRAPAAGTSGVGSAVCPNQAESTFEHNQAGLHGDDQQVEGNEDQGLPTQTKQALNYDHPDLYPKARKTWQAQQLFDIHPQDLPTSLRFGLPPDMTNQLNTTFWALKPQQTHTQAPHLRHRMGIRDSTRKQRIVSMQNNKEAQEQLNTHNLQQLTARQAFQHLRGQQPPTTNIALPTNCTDLPPEQPNVYTDGSLINPTESHFCLGGAGVWHPQRQLDNTGASEAEANLATLEQEASGLKLFTQMCGYGGSSTRMEIAGAIIGIAANGATHLGTDSSSFMRKALTLHQHINQHTLPKRPWPIQRDGDMWHMYFQHAAAKSVSAIAISKVKGHATDDMVEAGQVRAADKLGNDKADEAADEGVTLFGAPMVRLSKNYTKRHIAYSQLVADIHEHLAFIYKVRAALLQHHENSTTKTTTTHTNKQPGPTQQAATPAHQTNHHNTQHFTQLIQVQQCPHLCKRIPAITFIQTFLLDMPYQTPKDGSCGGGGRALGTSSVESADAAVTSSRTQGKYSTNQGKSGDGSNQAIGTSSVDSADTAATHTCHHEHDQDTFGITWLELYTLYRMAGHPEPLTYDTTQATARPTLRQQIHTFRHAIRQLVNNTMPQQNHKLFKGKGGIHGKRLGTLGINTNLAILPWQPDITSDTRNRVAQEIIRSQHRISLKQACAALAEGKEIALRQLQLKGRVKWSANIKTSKQPLYNQPTSHHTTSTTTHNKQPYHPTSTAASTQPQDYHTAAEQQMPTQTQTQPPPTPLPQLIFLVCPRCTHQLPGTRNAFRHNNLDARLWCNQCQRSRFIKAWRCQCGLPWHSCPQHKHEPQRLREAQAAKASPHQTPIQTTGTTSTRRVGTKRHLGTGQDEHINRWLDMPVHKQQRSTPTHIELEDIPTSNQPTNKRSLKTHLLGPKLLAKLARFTKEPNEGQPPPYSSEHRSSSSS